MIRQIVWTKQFKKDYKLAVKRGLPIEMLDEVIRLLSNNVTLPLKYRDHELTGKWSLFRECHVMPDWLLIYFYSKDKLILTLTRTGKHSDIFK